MTTPLTPLACTRSADYGGFFDRPVRYGSSQQQPRGWRRAQERIGQARDGRRSWHEQLKAIILTLFLAIAATFVLAHLVKMVVGLRPAPEIERQGLDLMEHGEEGYIE